MDLEVYLLTLPNYSMRNKERERERERGPKEEKYLEEKQVN